MIDQRDIQRAANVLLDAAPTGSRVILFGSQARRAAGIHSDLDFLVIEPQIAARRRETVRLLQALAPLSLPVDVLVISQAAFAQWRDVPNTVYFDAARDGVECHANTGELANSAA